MLKKLSTLALCSASAFALNTAEININDTDLELMGKIDVGQVNPSVEPGTVFIGARILNADKTHSSDKETNNEVYGELNFLMQKEIPGRGLSFGMGVKVNYTNISNMDFISIPLGVEAKFKIPAKNLVPMYVGASVYYAPRVLAFNDADNFFEYRINYDVEVIENGMLTVGYRSLDMNYDITGGDYNYNKSLYFGFKFAF